MTGLPQAREVGGVDDPLTALDSHRSPIYNGSSHATVAGHAAPHRSFSIRRLLGRWWDGPADLPPGLKLEWRFTVLRWSGVIILIPLMPFLGLSSERLLAGYGVLVATSLYNAVVAHYVARRALSVLPYVTSTGDILLNISMLIVLGGDFDAPFGYFVFATTAAIAMRFSYAPALSAASAFIIINLLVDLLAGKPMSAPFIFRSGFLFLTTLLACYLRDQAIRAQAAVEQRNQDLHRAYTDLAAAHQELLQADEMKTTFLANVSHELRTPLTSIRSFSELLLNYDDDPQTQQEFIQIINVESERLTRLVNDVLDITKIEAGRMDWNMRSVDLGELLENTARLYRPLIQQHGLTFEVNVPPDLPPIYADRDRLLQVVSNLMDNAIKFTRQGTIELSGADLGDEVLVSVRDSGIGIPPEYQERVFEKFHQVGQVLTDKPKGTGLGLAICREIVAHHGGRLWVESEPGEGSTFKLSLPIATDSEQLPEAVAQAR